MDYEEKLLSWSITDDFSDDEEDNDEDDEEGLDEVELDRLRFFAEHPDLADPLIWFLSERCFRQGRY